VLKYQTYNLIQKNRHTTRRNIMGAPSRELVDLWLAKAFNAHDVEAAAAMYHPDASVVRLDPVHGTDAVARGAGARSAKEASHA
jgi:ketosteroid isomerase-like protein